MENNIIPKIADGEVRYENGRYEYYKGDAKLDRFALLAAAAEATDKKSAIKIMNAVSRLYMWQKDVVFESLYECVMAYICITYHETEFNIQAAFIEALPSLFDGKAKRIQHKNDQQHQPDAWIQIDEEVIPVEMKKGAFGKKALEQLQRYMTHYNCKAGIAVGQTLTVELPEGITFISHKKFYKVAKGELTA